MRRCGFPGGCGAGLIHAVDEFAALGLGAVVVGVDFRAAAQFEVGGVGLHRFLRRLFRRFLLRRV